MKRLVGILFFCGLFLVSAAQRTCGTVSMQQIHAMQSRPAGTFVDDAALNKVINIPIVVHVLYNTSGQNISDTQILSQIAVLNQDYNKQNSDTSLTPDAFKSFAGNAKIHFCLAKIDGHGRNTTAIIRTYTNRQSFTTNDAMKYTAQGGDDAWDCTKYLNIWVCNLDSTSLGYGTFPGGPADRDGVVIGYNVFGTIGNLRVPFNKGRTATHEIGHWLGLRHTWGDAVCGNDSIADTPQQEAYNNGCPSFPHLSSCSPNASGDMFMDFMDFTDDGCMNMFTIDQVKEMKSLFIAGNARSSFLFSYQCDSLLPQGGALPSNPVSVDTVIQHPIVNVYPNPAHEQLTIELSNMPVIKETACLYNAFGAVIFEMQLNEPKSVANIAQLPAGVYILQVGKEKSMFTAKIIHD